METSFSPFIWSPLSMVVKNIISLISPEKIYLLSAIYCKQGLESIFSDKGSKEEESVLSFYLLILTQQSETRSENDLQEIIENHPWKNIPVTPIIMNVHRFNDLLIKANPFAIKVYNNAKLYFDAENIPLAMPDEFNETIAMEVLSRKVDRKFKLAFEFVSGAELYIVRKNYALAAFNLHQAAEQMYTGIIMFVTGLRVQTHNLDKLYRQSKYLLKDLTGIFPRDTEPEKDLFKWLQKAYVEGRYNADYDIKYPIISQLIQRIKSLFELCQNIQHPKIIIP